MDKLKSLFSTDVDIEFDNPDGVFTSGYEVTGSVILAVKELEKASAVVVLVYGEAHTKFSQGEGYGDHYHTVYFSARTPYVSESTTVWTSDSGPSIDNNPEGIHRFPFKFLLPSNCSSSFEGKDGNIRYYCEARIYLPWYKSDKTIKRLFTVIAFSDLNLIPNARFPLQRNDSKEIGFCCCKSGSISMTVRLLKGGFVPGEVIALDADIINDSTEKIEKIRMSLIQFSVFKAHREVKLTLMDQTAEVPAGTSGDGIPHRDYDKVVSRSEEKVEILERATDTITSLFPIPPDVVSINNCPIITVDYSLKIEMETSGILGDKVSVTLPLIIGTIPLRRRYK